MSVPVQSTTKKPTTKETTPKDDDECNESPLDLGEEITVSDMLLILP